MIVDCAYDKELAQEIVDYLKKEKIDAKIENESIITSEKLSKDDLDLFLKRTGKIQDLQIIESDYNTVIVARKVSIEKFGLTRCSMCGFIMHEEERLSHERAHGVQLFF